MNILEANIQKSLIDFPRRINLHRRDRKIDATSIYFIRGNKGFRLLTPVISSPERSYLHRNKIFISKGYNRNAN